MDNISAKKMAKKISKIIKPQNPNYDYIRDVFRFVRQELNVPVTTTTKILPYVPTEDEIIPIPPYINIYDIIINCV